MAFKRSNLTEMIGGNKVLTSNFGTQRNLTKENANHVSSDQLIFVTSNLKLKIRNKNTCKRSSVIYLMECCFCKKSEYNLENLNINFRINTYRNDVWRTGGPPCDKHFQMSDHNFNDHVRFTIIEQVKNESLS